MNQKVKKFIENNKYLIEDSEWDKFFKNIITTPYISALTEIIEVLESADILPFGSYLSGENSQERAILYALEWITGQDDNQGSYIGAYAKDLREGLNYQDIKIDKIARIALQLGYLVYKTTNGYYGDDDYIIINPISTLKDWWNYYMEGVDNSWDFDPTEYDEITSISQLNLNESLEEDIEDVVITDNSLTLEEPTKDQINLGYSNLISSLIKSEYDAIEDYNSAISTIKAEGADEYMVEVLKDILDEENIHVGQLQKLLQQVSESAENISKGEEEAEEQISAEKVNYEYSAAVG